MYLSSRGGTYWTPRKNYFWTQLDTYHSINGYDWSYRIYTEWKWNMKGKHLRPIYQRQEIFL